VVGFIGMVFEQRVETQKAPAGDLLSRDYFE
jgi:hypothetical protein